MTRAKLSLAFLVSGSLLWTGAPRDSEAANQPVTQPAAQSTPQSPEALDQMVAPIALYPDSLIAQILAGSTYPTEVVEADRWMHQHSGLAGGPLAQQVDRQAWDPSVKALTQFPSVLANMDTNLSWTSALGEAYATSPQAVLDAVQVMRRRAQQTGSLKSTPQESVTTEGQTIAIQEANPEVVYVPEYDPWLAYGGPIAVYPGWVPVPGLFLAGPAVGFSLGIGVGIFAGFGWGWHHWGANWHGHSVLYDHHAYVSHSPTFANRGGHFYGGHGGFAAAGGFHGAFPHGQAGTRAGAFGGFDHGGIARSFSSRGRTSPGGGGHYIPRFHGGGHR